LVIWKYSVWQSKVQQMAVKNAAPLTLPPAGLGIFSNGCYAAHEFPAAWWIPYRAICVKGSLVPRRSAPLTQPSLYGAEMAAKNSFGRLTKRYTFIWPIVIPQVANCDSLSMVYYHLGGC